MDWYGNGLGRWITYYNTQRPHSGLAGRTPVEAYRWIGQSDHGGHAPRRQTVQEGGTTSLLLKPEASNGSYLLMGPLNLPFRIVV